MDNCVVDISVLIPVYGVERYIERALRSIFNQTKTKGVEYIIVNDCTKDSSMDIARKVITQFPNLDIQIIEHKENGGLAVARQTAMEAAKGEYIIHFDSDDWCEPSMLEDMYNAIIADKSDVVVCDFYYSTPKSEEYVKQNSPNSGNDCLVALLSDKLHAGLWSKMFRRDIFVKNNLKWVPQLNMWEDMLICSKFFFCASKVTYLPKAYLHYMQIGGSITNALDYSKIMQKIDSEVKVVVEIENYLKMRGAADSYKELLVGKKMRVKFDALYRTKGSVQREYATLFGDINREDIERLNSLLPYYKKALILASSGKLAYFNMLRRAKKIQTKLLNREKGSF